MGGSGWESLVILMSLCSLHRRPLSKASNVDKLILFVRMSGTRARISTRFCSLPFNRSPGRPSNGGLFFFPFFFFHFYLHNLFFKTRPQGDELRPTIYYRRFPVFISKWPQGVGPWNDWKFPDNWLSFDCIKISKDFVKPSYDTSFTWIYKACPGGIAINSWFFCAVYCFYRSFFGERGNRFT